MDSSSNIVNEIEKIINSIHKSVIETGVEIYPDGIEEHAGSYAAMVKKLYAKAKQCLDIFKKQSRAKVLEFAQQTPDLQEEYNRLNFEELKEWLNICNQLEIGGMENIEHELKEIETIITTIYKPSDRITSFLRFFKVLSLAKSPLSNRVKILRALHRENPTNKDWEKDLINFETAYLEKLIKFANSARKEKDLITLESISSELKSKEWSIEIHQTALDQINKYLNECREIHAQRHFKDICEKIHEAQSKMDEIQCRCLMAKWVSISKRYNVVPSGELQQQIMPVKQWIESFDLEKEKDKHYSTACQNLENVLDKSSKLEELESIAGEILSFERGMPEILAAQFNSRVQELKLKKKRHFTLMMSGTIGILLILSSLLIFLVYQTNKKKEILTWETRIKNNLDNGNIEAALTLFAQVPQKFLSDPKIIQLKIDTQSKQVQERDRVKAFSSLLKSLSATEVNYIDSQQLHKAETLARTSKEKNQIMEIQINYDKYLTDQKRVRETAFEQRLELLETIFKELCTIDQTNTKKFLSKADECLQFANTLASEPNISMGLMARAKNVREATLKVKNDVENALQSMKLAENDIAQIADSFNTPKNLAEKIKKFIQQYPNHECRTEFDLCISYENAWVAADAWMPLYQNLKLPQNSVAVTERISQIDNYLKFYQDSPYTASLKNYKNYLEKSKLIFENDKFDLQLNALMEFFNSPLLADSMVIVAQNGDSYYMIENTMKKDMDPDGQVRYRFKYISDATLTSVGTTLKESEIKNKLQVSPQCELVKNVKNKINEYKNGNISWETLYWEIADSCLSKKEMDPILAANILKAVLTINQEITPFQNDNVSVILDEFSKINLDVPWMNPKNKEVNSIRKQTQIAIEKIVPEIKKCYQCQEDQSRLLASSIIPYECFGIILGTNKEIKKKITSTDNKTIFIITSESDNPTCFVKLGELVNNNYIIDQSLLSKTPMGTPLYCKKKTEKEN